MRELSPGGVGRPPVTRDGRRANGSRALGAAGCLTCVAWALATPPLAAQGARVTGVTVARYIEIRPFVTDSVPRSTVVDSVGTLYRTADGLIVGCEGGRAYCSYMRSDDALATIPITQDVQASAWGFGEGISMYAHVRLRTAVGESGAARELWPRADDELDPLAAYVEMDRSRFRGRVGRQWVTSGLGFYNFDGVSLLYRPWNAVSVDAYGGWSLARGLHEPHTGGAIAAVEDIVPDERAYIVGLEARVRPERRWAAGLLYQREIMTTREALYTERVAIDAHLLFPRGGLDIQLESDLATGDVNDLWLRGNLGLTESLGLRADLRRYEPFFELWTIWGAFDPGGFDEARLAAHWRTGSPLEATIAGAYRRYHETNAGVQSLSLRDDGWRVAADAAWRPRPRWITHGSVAVDLGFGATRTDADLGLRWEGARADVGARVTAFQSVFELRVGTGRVVGAGLDGAVRLRDDLRVIADLALYRHADRHHDSGGPTLADWSQLRGALRVQWTVGRDPGMPVDSGSERRERPR
jgi:hypothetical protein